MINNNAWFIFFQTMKWLMHVHHKKRKRESQLPQEKGILPMHRCFLKCSQRLYKYFNPNIMIHSLHIQVYLCHQSHHCVTDKSSAYQGVEMTFGLVNLVKFVCNIILNDIYLVFDFLQFSRTVKMDSQTHFLSKNVYKVCTFH